MKFYETHYEDYVYSVEKCNLHPELSTIMKSFPTKVHQLENLIISGPAGVGKYSQVLSLIKKYSPSELKYDKKITAQTDKQQYIYRMSDIHYEVDMSLLGCNSKLLWHELFFQIVDIISVKQDKIGIILCKNFHLIHAELLEIFYSYMQNYNHTHASIKIIFFLMTEHISFLPTPIINACHVLKIGRPHKDKYLQIAQLNIGDAANGCSEPPSMPVNSQETPTNAVIKPSFMQRVATFPQVSKDSKKIPFYNGCNFKTESYNNSNLFKNVEMLGITNIKEVRSFPLLITNADIPKDIFNIICDNIIKEIINPTKISFTGFRDTLYDILTYNLDTIECLWYILSYFIENGHLKQDDVTEILIKCYVFLKYYNNNYRPIYHLESIMFTIINKIHKFDEL